MKTHLFDTDLLEDPLLPSPNQLKYKILIKNKKIQRNSSGQNFGGNSQSQNSNSQPVQLGILNNGSAPTPKQQLSQNSKSSIWPVSNRSQNSEIRNKSGRVFSADETMVSTEMNNDEVIEIEHEISSPPIVEFKLKPTNSKLGSSMVKKILTISTRLTSAEPRLKKNVANLIHKSRSLTDSAFNRISGGNLSSKIKSNKLPNFSQTNHTSISEVIPLSIIGHQAEVSFTSPQLSPMKHLQNPSISAFGTSVIGITQIPTETDLGSTDLSYSTLIKKRYILYFISFVSC